MSSALIERLHLADLASMFERLPRWGRRVDPSPRRDAGARQEPTAGGDLGNDVANASASANEFAADVAIEDALVLPPSAASSTAGKARKSRKAKVPTCRCATGSASRRPTGARARLRPGHGVDGAGHVGAGPRDGVLGLGRDARQPEVLAL